MGDREAGKGQHPAGASRCALGLGKQGWLPTGTGGGGRGTPGLERGGRSSVAISDARQCRGAETGGG